MLQTVVCSLVVSALAGAGCRFEPAAAPRSDGGPTRMGAEQEQVARPPVELIVALDTSASMTRRHMRLARGFITQLVHELDAADQFGLVLIADDARVAIEQSNATPKARHAWSLQIQSFEGSGLTNLEDGFELAETLASPDAIVVLITDGTATWGTVSPSQLSQKARDLDLWTVGVGRRNEQFLKELGRYRALPETTEQADALARELLESAPLDR